MDEHLTVEPRALLRSAQRLAIRPREGEQLSSREVSKSLLGALAEILGAQPVPDVVGRGGLVDEGGSKADSRAWEARRDVQFLVEFVV